MANNCAYDMRVVGETDKVREFYKMLYDYEMKPHFRRVFFADVYDERKLDDGRLVLDIVGDCAWSVYSCMCEGAFTYASDYPEDSTSLQQQSLEKNLQIEVFSTEPGIGFAEHFLYDCGSELENKCVDYQERYFEDDEWSREEFEELQASGAMSKQEKFEDWIGEAFRMGGFQNLGFCIP